jgi:hypothetical protein
LGAYSVCLTAGSGLHFLCLWVRFVVKISTLEQVIYSDLFLFFCFYVLIFILNLLHILCCKPVVVCDSPNQAHFIMSSVFKMVDFLLSCSLRFCLGRLSNVTEIMTDMSDLETSDTFYPTAKRFCG